MKFDADKQTLEDLALYPNGQRKSVLSLFGNTQTIGGQEMLAFLSAAPLTDAAETKKRIDVFNYLRDNEVRLEVDKNSCDFVEYYLKRQSTNIAFPLLSGLLNRLIYTFNRNNKYYVTTQGIIGVLELLENLSDYSKQLTGNLPEMLSGYKAFIDDVLQADDFIVLKQYSGKLKAADITRFDHLFRKIALMRLKELLEIIYYIDAYQTIWTGSQSMGFTVPVIEENKEPLLTLEGLFHPFVNNPVRNDIEFAPGKNVCFVTGTNMAGKSTLLKALGISIYLSQLGFPVPASFMKTSLFNGLITTINLADDIEQGQSHFYREVLRVKQVAEKINQAEKLFVIFDELFRGTNVKDAYDASLAIIGAFAEVRHSFFVVSTHIVEVAHQLSAIENIRFRFMETTFNDNKPSNSYKLKDGITEERLGMWIVNNENIIDIIKNVKEPRASSGH